MDFDFNFKLLRGRDGSEPCDCSQAESLELNVLFHGIG